VFEGLMCSQILGPK